MNTPDQNKSKTSLTQRTRLGRVRGKITLRSALIVLAITGVFGGIIYFAISSNSSGGGQGPGGGFGPFGGGMGGPRTQPVSASEVKVMDVPIWINAIGTMIPKNLVTVRSRVDGELLKLNFKEGQLVKAGQLLAEIDPRALQVQLIQANGQFIRDSAQLKNAQLDLERYRLLLSKDSISKQQVDTQEALVRQYQGTVEVDRGVVANAQLQLSYTKITAPVSGRIGLRQVDPGNIVKASDTTGIAIIAQVQPITAVFSVPEINLPVVTESLASKEPVAVEVWDRELKNKLATGKLLTADNQIDTTTGTLKLKGEFSNEDNKLFPNQFVNVKLAAGVAKEAKVVPNSAVLRGAKGNYVYVINDTKVAAVPVTVGATSGDLIVITGPIAAGAQVVTDGADKLRDGAEVQVITEEARKKATSSEGNKPRGEWKRRREGGQAGGPPSAGAAAGNGNNSAPSNNANASAGQGGSAQTAPAQTTPSQTTAGNGDSASTNAANPSNARPAGEWHGNGERRRREGAPVAQ